LNFVEICSLAPLAAIIIFLGLNPNPMINIMSASANHLIEIVKVAYPMAGM